MKNNRKHLRSNAVIKSIKLSINGCILSVSHKIFNISSCSWLLSDIIQVNQLCLYTLVSSARHETVLWLIRLFCKQRFFKMLDCILLVRLHNKNTHFRKKCFSFQSLLSTQSAISHGLVDFKEK